VTRTERDLRDLCQRFAAEGAPVAFAGMAQNSHYIIAVGGRKVFASGTPGDKRATKNLVGWIRKNLALQGIDVPRVNL
jgi:hypothetical protein